MVKFVTLEVVVKIEASPIYGDDKKELMNTIELLSKNFKTFLLGHPKEIWGWDSLEVKRVKIVN